MIFDCLFGHEPSVHKRDEQGRLMLVCPRCGVGDALLTRVERGEPTITPITLPPIQVSKAILAPKTRTRKPKKVVTTFPRKAAM